MRGTGSVTISSELRISLPLAIPIKIKGEQMKYWTVTGSNLENMKVVLSLDMIKRHEARMARGKKVGLSESPKLVRND